MRFLSTLTLVLSTLVFASNSQAEAECKRIVKAFSKMANVINDGMINVGGDIRLMIYADRKENTAEQSAYIKESFAKAALGLATDALETYETKLCEKAETGLGGVSLELTNTDTCNDIARWVDKLEFASSAAQNSFYAAIREMWLISGGQTKPDKRSWTDCQLDVNALEVDRVRKD